MDQLRRYRTLIKQHLRHVEELANRNPEPGVDTLCVLDDKRDQYMLVRTGWSGVERVRGMTLYVRIRDGKIWVEEDWTEDGIVDALLQAGVPKRDIVLAFHSPRKRRMGEFAVA